MLDKYGGMINGQLILSKVDYSVTIQPTVTTHTADIGNK